MNISDSARKAVRALAGAVGIAAIAAAGPAASAPAAAAAPPATTAAPALPADLVRRAAALVDADTPRLVELFKDLHRHPELAFLETRTAGVVAKELRALGFEVTEGIGKTGVVGVLRNGPGPVLWFRADMDANGGIQETTGLPWAATDPQRLPNGTELHVMHACGHDAHVVWMLGMARAMVALKDAWSGTLVAYGQPAEETILGAQAMVKDGLWTRGFPKPDYAMGVHAVPGPVGLVASAPGVRMAGTDQIDVTFFGVGGHGSSPHLAIDPVVMAAQAVLGYQTIISRTIDPQQAAVLTVGAIEAGRDNNVIPEEAVLRLNTRWFSTAVREQLIARVDAINDGIVRGAGMPVERGARREMKGSAGPLTNDAALVARVTPSLRALLGDDRVIDDLPSVLGSEDFQEAFAELRTPYVYSLVGIAPPAMFAAAQKAGRVFPFANHNPDFFVDLAAIPVGAKVNTVKALSILAKP